MVDGIRIRIPRLLDLSELQKLDFKVEKRFPNSSTVEYGFYGLKIRVTEKATYIEGSIHKFWNLVSNGRRHNSNAFHIRDVIWSLNYLCDELSIHPNECIVQTLEFGINIHLDIPASEFISQSIIAYKWRAVNRNDDVIKGRKAKNYRWEINDTWLKVYDKSLDAGIHHKNILRLEIKMLGRRAVSRLNISTLSDLLLPDTYPHLLEELVKAWDKLTVVDAIKPSIIMPMRYRSSYNKFTNPKTYELYQSLINSNAQRKQFSREYAEFQRILAEYKLDSQKRTLRTRVKSIGRSLLAPSVSQNPLT